ncbi:MAG TPA: chalcone isomerase family protein [Acidobacteriota bacterium]|nr:chalcone isomerase family protein [Acidobacteriota bacterium]
MNKRLLFTAAFWFAVSGSAQTNEVAGVKMDTTITLEGKSLQLNGIGLRKKLIFKVYVAGLYLENRSKDSSSVVSSEQIKSIRLHMLRSLSGSELSDAISEAFWRNVKSGRNQLEARLQKLASMFPSVVAGDIITLTYVPGKGTTVTAKGQQKGIVEGKDFADALLSVWLGDNPVQADLKRALLGS